MLTTRLDNQLEEELSDYCLENSISKSEVVKQSLALFLETRKKKPTPYELGKDSFGKYGRGYSLPHSEHKNYLREKIRAKISR